LQISLLKLVRNYNSPPGRAYARAAELIGQEKYMADKKKNYYEILGVDKKATDDEIRAAYKKLVKKYHPDLHPGDAQAAEMFKQVNEANEVLSDKQKRAAYDFELDRPARAAAGAGAGGAGAGAGGFGGFSDIFDSIFQGFGGAGASQQPDNTGEDIQKEMPISFMDAAKGCTKDITYVRNEPCAACKGTGAKNGTAFRPCVKCGGKGQVRFSQDTMFGRTVRVGMCPDCNGTGKAITEKCPDCKGKGYLRKDTKVVLTIPAGVDNGSYMKKRGFGMASTMGGAPGDLIITFKVESHKIFTRKGLDLYVDLPVPFTTAMLGGTVKVPDLDDVFDYPIAAGTQSGQIFTVRGKGIKNKNGTGSLFIRIIVEVPIKLNREQRKMMEEAAASYDARQFKKGNEYAEDISALYGVNPYTGLSSKK